MADLTHEFNHLLKQREAPPTRSKYNLEQVDEFLKEAYQISSKIHLLHAQLRDVRQAYLSTAAPRRSLRASSKAGAGSSGGASLYLTDRQREEIDASAKTGIRNLNAKIRTLAEAEEIRQHTEAQVLAKKYQRGLGGSLGKWAAGGGGGMLGKGKSPEYLAAEEASRQLGAHRESVLWYLRQKLQELGALQQYMMETRLTREMEKNRSVLAKARSGPMAFGIPGPGLSSFGETGGAVGISSTALEIEEREKKKPTQGVDLTKEEVQMFEKDNQAMLKYYQGTLDKVRTAEQSLIEISELQTLLVNNLATQSAHIDQLVEDSMTAAENVGGGNKQLKKATQRASPARYTFFAATGLCLFLIGWDLFV